MTRARSGWDGVSEFYDDDEDQAAVNAMWSRPVDAVTGEPFDPADVKAIQDRDASD